ncbi:GFA family protein [Novosphingobium sp. P6W]|uniref:GFA family protein n=1 Tax=Novosphingobium sp. P6W TaxID=1609758 RepID=UPI0005C2B7BD|nr:GFA family protein [Novosphingobium sp. P6W]AXB76736.1 aldehyde-activating protein [Novosphingobium sp. P6W]KIS33407.1 aldehyde-activating protein [Novosphingobium sp. P6W]
MAAPYTGRCNCGAIAVTITAEPVATRQCWCRQCQRIAAGGPTNNAMFPAEAVTITGPRADHAYVAASGNVLTHEFCADCGTPVLGRSNARPQFRTIRLGLLDEGHGLKPAMAIWTDEAPDWAVIDPALERFPAQPPAPVPSSAS